MRPTGARNEKADASRAPKRARVLRAKSGDRMEEDFKNGRNRGECGDGRQTSE